MEANNPLRMSLSSSKSRCLLFFLVRVARTELWPVSPPNTFFLIEVRVFHEYEGQTTQRWLGLQPIPRTKAASVCKVPVCSSKHISAFLKLYTIFKFNYIIHSICSFSVSKKNDLFKLHNQCLCRMKVVFV